MKSTRDPVVDEVRRHRDTLAAKFEYDLVAIVADIQSRQRKNPLLVRRKKRSTRIG